MKIITNPQLIKRNRQIGQTTTIVALVVLGGGLYISFAVQSMVTYSFLALIVGFLLSQIGIYFTSRWGRSPRPDERLTASLKGLDDKYSLYHYRTAVSHLLVGPAGVWILLPYNQKGLITYDNSKNRWKQKGGSTFLKLFSQEGLGRPDLDAKSASDNLQKFFNKEFTDANLPPIQTALIFVEPGTDVEAQEAPIPTLSVEKLKDFIRRQAKQDPLQLEQFKLIQTSLPSDGIDQ
jgi:hypothetical protein